MSSGDIISVMNSEELKSMSSHGIVNTQLKELEEIKDDVEHLQNELLTVQKKYDQRLLEYQCKLEEAHHQIERIGQEQEEKEINLLNATSEWLEIKSKLERSVMSPKQKVVLNVGGHYFETTIGTLTKDSEGAISYFQSLFSQQWQLEKDPKDESIFIDRDGILFSCIIQYFRTGQVAIDFNNALLRRDLLTEAKFYKIDSLVRLLNTNEERPSKKEHLFLNTQLLSSEHQIQLNKFCDDGNEQWQLIYRASRDGYTAKMFHKCCDNQCPTMTVIRAQNGYIFGAFTTVPWSSAHADKADSSAFLFTLKNPWGIIPTKYPIHKSAIQFAVSHRSSSGPTFGSVQNGGSDIFLHGPFNVNGSRIFFPQSYKDTTGNGNMTFTGDSHFYSDDVEVFTPV